MHSRRQRRPLLAALLCLTLLLLPGTALASPATAGHHDPGLQTMAAATLAQEVEPTPSPAPDAASDDDGPSLPLVIVGVALTIMALAGAVARFRSI